MYFVTTKRDGYVLFALTPSERAAVGLTDGAEVHLLRRQGHAGDWTVFAKWSARDYSHTEFMSAWHHRNEPEDVTQLVEVAAAHLRGE